jgi:protein tyrosine phosphatase (PTP) superfamily phosphohydrolase (DUF442 family)
MHSVAGLALACTGNLQPPARQTSGDRKVDTNPMDPIDRVMEEETRGALDLDWITDRIALGGWIETEEKMRAVAQQGITHIVNMAWEFDETALARAYGIQVLSNAVDDDFQPKPAEVLERGVQFAQVCLCEKDTKVLIHCVAGRHRGPMMALALLCVLGWEMEDAMRCIAERRPIVDWTPVYVDSVQNFLKYRSMEETA